MEIGYPQFMIIGMVESLELGFSYSQTVEVVFVLAIPINSSNTNLENMKNVYYHTIIVI